MRISTLERVLIPERSPRKAGMSGEFAYPVIGERESNPSEAPFVVTNARGSFVETRLSKASRVRYGFIEALPGEEGPLLPELHRVLWKISESYGWSNRCKSLRDALDRMARSGVKPYAMVLPMSLLRRVSDAGLDETDVERLMLTKGHVTKVDDVLVLVSTSLPEGAALVTATPGFTGFYTRVDDRLAVLIQKADRSVMVVRDAVA